MWYWSLGGKLERCDKQTIATRARSSKRSAVLRCSQHSPAAYSSAMPASKKYVPLAKQICLCCQKLLRPRTIDNHVSGKHLPTLIKLARQQPIHNDLASSDLTSSGPPSDLGHSNQEANSMFSAPPSVLDRALDEAGALDDFLDLPDNPVEFNLANAWSGRLAEVHDYYSDSEDSESSSYKHDGMGTKRMERMESIMGLGLRI